MKIANGLPAPTVTIVAGSQFVELEDIVVSKANLSGVSYDADERVHTFNESVEVALDGPDYLPRLFGLSVRRWKSRAGISLTDALPSL